MTAAIGSAAILVAVASAAVLIVQGLRGALRPESVGVAHLRPAVLSLALAALLAMLALEVALLTDDFSLEYVANHHATTTPWVYTIATAWAALEGSIVLWGLVLAGFTWLVYRQVVRRSAEEGGDPLGVGALAVMGIVSLFFFGLMATAANPFRVCVEAASVGCLEASSLPWAAAAAPVQGLGPNPLLQNHILMAFHPPVLYVGYVGLTAPFAFALSSLLVVRRGSEWLRRTRRWTLVAWSFLTAGIVLGGVWSYEVLGWGGYWAWDPVENASLLPWLIATAFIHSAAVQARRGVLQAWNYVLVISAFSLTILGTFLTRSGTIASVHSFTQSAVGPAILGFLVVVVAGSFGLFALRVHRVASAPRLDSLVSREGAFLLNNLLLTVYAFVVLTGTLYPILVEAFTGDQVGVGRPWFDRLAIPLSFGLLLAMGVGPVTPYRVARPGLVWHRLHGPLQGALAAGALLVVLGERNGYVIGGLVCSTFVVGVIVRHLVVSARAAAAKHGGGTASRAWALIRRDPGYWGGQLSHIGVAMLALGIVLSANLAERAVLDLQPGDRVEFAGRELAYRGGFQRDEPNRVATGATVEVYRDGRLTAVLQPRFNAYPTSPQPVVTPAVDATLTGDLYLSLRRIDATGASIEASWFPFQWMVWLGGIVTALGGIAALARRRRSAVLESIVERAGV